MSSFLYSDVSYVIHTFQVFVKSLSDSFLIPLHQLPRVFFHGLILAVIICGFWLLDSLKDPVLIRTVGIEYQPTAKVCSVLTTIFVVCIYDYCTSIVDKPTLFHLVSGAFGLIMMIMAAELSDPVNGLPNADKGPHRVIGWVCYFSIEAYGSLMVALFWSFTNSIMNLEEAKGAYGLIISIAQVGAIFGSTLATNATSIGIPQLFLVGSMTIFSVSLLIKIYHIIFNDAAASKRGSSGGGYQSSRIRSLSESSNKSLQHHSNSSRSSSDDATSCQSCRKVVSGFYEGLILIFNYRYVQYLLGISCLFEIAVTVLDYEFKLLGAGSITANMHSTFTTDADSNKFANLLGHFGQLTNLLSFFISFFGFSFLVYKIGVKLTLLIFPCILFCSVILANVAPSFWVLFTMVSVLKALIFSLNEPVKELLYIPTSELIKFKAKAWIDVFGSRFAKAAGSFITNLAHGKVDRLRTISELPCIAVAIGMIILSWIIGTEFTRLINENIIVGNEDNEDDITGHSAGDDTYKNLKVRNGKRPGDIGYDGYDLHIFDGIFDDADADADMNVIGRYSSRNNSTEKACGNFVV